MCEFVIKTALEGQMIQTKYEVLGFDSEDKIGWFFLCQVVGVKVHGKIYDKTSPEKIIVFPKRKQIGENSETRDGEKVKVPIYEDLTPPPFYEKLRNRAVLTGRVKAIGEEPQFGLWDQPPTSHLDIDPEAAEKVLEEIRRKNAERGIA